MVGYTRVGKLKSHGDTETILLCFGVDDGERMAAGEISRLQRKLAAFWLRMHYGWNAFCCKLDGPLEPIVCHSTVRNFRRASDTFCGSRRTFG